MQNKKMPREDIFIILFFLDKLIFSPHWDRKKWTEIKFEKILVKSTDLVLAEARGERGDD